MKFHMYISLQDADRIVRFAMDSDTGKLERQGETRSLGGPAPLLDDDLGRNVPPVDDRHLRHGPAPSTRCDGPLHRSAHDSRLLIFDLVDDICDTGVCPGVCPDDPRAVDR